MPDAADRLKAQIEADPRVSQLAQSRQRGSMPGVITTQELRQMGYPVEDDWTFMAGNPGTRGWTNAGANGGSLVDPSDKYRTGVKVGAITLGALAGGGMLGYGPLAGAPAAMPGAAAPAVATQAGGVTGGILPGAVASPTVGVTGGTLAATAPAAAGGVAPGIVAGGAGGGILGMDAVTAGILGGSTIASIFGARQQANAAKDAAATQAASADKALALAREIWESQRADQRPWVSAGTGAVNTLTNLMGVPMMQPGTTSGERMPLPPTGGGSLPPLAPGVRLGTAPEPRQVGTGQTLAAMASPQPMGGGSAYVTLQSPDGATRQVPEAMAGQFEARGARRL